MSLKTIVAALGGELYDGGRRASIPAPGHSRSDRSVSLLLVDGRVIAHSFGSAGWQDVLDDLRARRLINGQGRLAGGEAQVVEAERTDRIAAARRLWDEAQPIGIHSAAARHLSLRGVRTPAGDLRAHPAASVRAYSGTGPTRPALVAGIRDPGGALTAVELTYLTPQGERDLRLRLPRKTVGRLPPGCAVRLAAWDKVLLVAEGVFSALSASERFGLPAWALLSVGNLAGWSPPDGIAEVLIAADRDQPGAAAAARLAGRLRALGVSVEIRRPPAPFGDWNEAWAARPAEREEGTDGAGAAAGWSGTPARRPKP